jgi:hypothetical protein
MVVYAEVLLHTIVKLACLVAITYPTFPIAFLIFGITAGTLGALGKLTGLGFMASNLLYQNEALLFGFCICVIHWFTKMYIIGMKPKKKEEEETKWWEFKSWVPECFFEQTNPRGLLLFVIVVMSTVDICLTHYLTTVNPLVFALVVGLGLGLFWFVGYVGSVYVLKMIFKDQKKVDWLKVVQVGLLFFFCNTSILISYNGFYKNSFLNLRETWSLLIGGACNLAMIVIMFVVVLVLKGGMFKKKVGYAKLKGEEEEKEEEIYEDKTNGVYELKNVTTSY